MATAPASGRRDADAGGHGVLWALAPLATIVGVVVFVVAPTTLAATVLGLLARRVARGLFPWWAVLVLALAPLLAWGVWAHQRGLLVTAPPQAHAGEASAPVSGLSARALAVATGTGEVLVSVAVGAWAPAWEAHRALLLELWAAAVSARRGGSGAWVWPATLRDPAWWVAYRHAVLPFSVLVGALVLAVAQVLRPLPPRPPAAPALGTREETPPDFATGVRSAADAGLVTHPPDGFSIGWTRDGERVDFRGPEERQHGLVSGLTGTRKTTLMKHLVCGALGRHPVVLLDNKGAADLVRFVDGVPGALVWTPGGPLRWSPFRGGVSDFASKLVAAAGTVTGEQMNKATQQYLQLVGRALAATGAPREPALVTALLDPAALAEYVTREVVPGRPALGWLTGEVALFRQNELALKALSELAGRVKVTLQGDAMPSLGDGPDALDLEAAIRGGRVVLFSLPGDTVAGQCLGAWLLVELRRVGAVLERDGWGDAGNLCLVPVDEVSALGPQARHLVAPLARMRSAGFAVWLFTQGLADIDRAVEKDAAEQILNNTRVHVAFAHQSVADRERWSEQFGTYEREEIAARPLVVDADGNGVPDEDAPAAQRVSARWKRVPRVPPDALRVLPDGYVYLSRPGAPHRPRRLDLVLIGRAPERATRRRRSAGWASRRAAALIRVGAGPARLARSTSRGLASAIRGVAHHARYRGRRGAAEVVDEVVDAEWRPVPERPGSAPRASGQASGQASDRAEALGAGTRTPRPPASW